MWVTGDAEACRWGCRRRIGWCGFNSTCLDIGVTTVGVGALVCGVLVLGGASFTAGLLGSAGGELVADKIFESSR